MDSTKRAMGHGYVHGTVGVGGTMKISTEKIKVAILGVLEEIFRQEAITDTIDPIVRNISLVFDVTVESAPKLDDEMVINFVMDFEKLHLFNGEGY